VKLSVIIPAFNEERLLGDALRTTAEAMGAFHRLGWQTELIVCDNNSTDRTAAIARAAGATVVFDPVNSIAGARNTGAKAASGDWFIFLDADSQPSAELFGDVAAEIQSGRCIAGGVTGKLDTSHVIARLFMFLWNRLSRIRRLLAGWMMFCEAATFRSIQGYDARLFVSEDIDISIRLRKLGRALGKRTVVLHRHPLLTSSRKVKLHGVWKHVWFVLKVAFTFGKPLTNREACPIWYDGRR